MAGELIQAAKAVVHQRDYAAESGGVYDLTTFHPGEDQWFDDWAADILEQALRTEGHLDEVDDEVVARA